MRTSPTSYGAAFLLALAGSSLLPACSSADSASPGASAPAIDDGLPATCSPLRTPGACMMPFPNAIDTVPDTSSKTGVRLSLVGEALPKASPAEKLIDTTPWNLADGFSPSTPIVCYFAERIDPKSLPFIDTPDTSLSPASATVLVDMETNALVAHFAEVDQTATQDYDRQALMMRPLARLQPNHRYAVGITTAIQTIDGKQPTPPPLFAAIADGAAPEDARSQAQAARMPAILGSLATAGVPRAKLVVAWDFVTASDEFVTGRVLSMRDQALTVIGESGLGYSITTKEAPNADVLRRIDGTFKAPRFLSQTDHAVAEASLELDANGLPKYRGDTFDVPFAVIVPTKAKDGPLPLMIFGHGLFGSGPDYMDMSELQTVANQYGYVMAATDWSGLSTWEFPTTKGGSGAAAEALLDLNHINWITDRLAQSIVNVITMSRTVAGKLAQDPAMTDTGQAGGQPVLDGSTPVYFGISLGGIMGTTFMGYGPDVVRGVTNVAGSTWSLMFQRSSNWSTFKLIMGGSYPDYLDQQLLLGLVQTPFDFTDPIGVASHVVADPLPGTPKKSILQQMSVDDTQVPNVSSEILARTIGLELVNDSPLAIWSMPPKAAPLANALTAWDTKPKTVPPKTNATPEENGAHSACPKIPHLQDQTDHFLRTGEVISTCEGGVCNPG